MTVTPRIVILSGAGISAESGLGTFRGENGLWKEFDVYTLATPEAFARNPERVHDFYNTRRRKLLESQPNAAHRAIAELELNLPNVTIVTQNVDNLHRKAGCLNVIHMHGELLRSRCLNCGTISDCDADLTPASVCPCCLESGSLRPHIVWFGEMPLRMDEIYTQLADCDIFIAIGTSGNVYPAAAFVEVASSAGAHTVELNLEPSESRGRFAECIYGPATEVVPEFTDRLIRKYG